MCKNKYTKKPLKASGLLTVKESYFLDSLYKGTAEQASPYIILLAQGCR